MNLSAAEPFADPCPAKTRADLEWDRILEALAERCVSHAGKRLARTPSFAATRAESLTALAEVREAVALDATGEPLPASDVAEIEDALDRARIGASLSNEELRGVLGLLGAARTLRQFLHSRRERCPSLHVACAIDPVIDAVARELSAAFDPDGTLSDRASPRLGLKTSSRSMRTFCRIVTGPSATGATFFLFDPMRTSASRASSMRPARAARQCSSSRGCSSRWATE
jgi:DNA mismatch repair protein MutS2